MKKILYVIILLIGVTTSFFTSNALTVNAAGCSHSDNEDEYKNLCDSCWAYLGDTDLVVGENTVLVDENSLIRFIPEESGMYFIYSNTDSDTKCNFYYFEDGNLINNSFDDEGEGFNFRISYDLVEGTSYYFSFGVYYDAVESYSVTIVKHEHTSSNEQTCLGYECLECHDYFGEAGEHRLSNEQTCLGYECLDCWYYYGEGSQYEHDFYDGECEICGMDEADYECVHETEDEQTCMGYYCYHCDGWYGEGNENHDLGTEQTCMGYRCYNCHQYFGEVDETNHYWYIGTCYHCKAKCEHHGGNVTCIGYQCEECLQFYGEVDEEKHLWYYGKCSYHTSVLYPTDLECDHNLDDDGECKICGFTCEHINVDSQGKCENCEYQYEYSVTTNGNTTFYGSLGVALDNSESGSYIKVLKDTAEFDSINFYKEVTFDLNGHSIEQPSSYSFYVYSIVRFKDSVGGGYINFTIDLNARCIFESGSYHGIGVNSSVLSSTFVNDILHPCSVLYKNGEIVELNGDEEYVEFVDVVSKHQENVTCIGTFCTSCKEVIGEADLNAHYYETYEKISDAECEVNAKESAICIYCNNHTDVREIENTKLEHVDNNKDHICDNECGKVDIGNHEDIIKDHNCDYGCQEVIGVCEDTNKDHACDYGCSISYGEHTDGVDSNHLCDYGCDKVADEGCYDENNDNFCDECLLEMTHNLGNYLYNEDGHWHECSNEGCEYAEEKTSHQYGDWITIKEPTETEKGSKTKKCECGHEVVEDIPMLVVTPEPQVNNGLTGGQIIGIIFGSIGLLGGLFALYWFVLRKKLFMK